ncbi:MAG TPA: polysaccharide lyase family 7 protein [Ktedonobacteraceae bacterium]|nr:polysaccharide lyase family 7 protein [Ktedonobacteraceae bacterium]
MKHFSRYVVPGAMCLLVILVGFLAQWPNISHASSSPLVLQYMPEETSATTDKIEPEFQIVNNGSSSVALSQLTIRYWFTADSSATLNPGCNYAVVGCSDIAETTGAVNPPVTGVDSYLQVGFTSGAGSVTANSTGGKIKLIIQKSDFSNFDQTNDYSFNASFTAFTNWQNVALYQNGTLVWGTEPGGTSTPTPTPTQGTTPTPTPTVGTTPTPTPTPSQNSIDLSIWQLQLPDNTSVGPPATSTSPWFIENRDGSWTFDDPGTGSNCTPTTNSTHCRTELREDDSATNGTKGGFSPSGTNILTATVAVNTDGWPVIGQIHADPSVSVKPVIELYYDHDGSGNVVAGVQTNCTTSGQTDTTLAPDPPLGQQMTYEISYSNNQLIVTFNGKTFNLSSQSGCLSSGVGGYFKAGDYGQENTLSVVTFYSVVVNHS